MAGSDAELLIHFWTISGQSVTKGPPMLMIVIKNSMLLSRQRLQFLIQCRLTGSQKSLCFATLLRWHCKHNMYTKIILFVLQIISMHNYNYKNNVKYPFFSLEKKKSHCRLISWRLRFSLRIQQQGFCSVTDDHTVTKQTTRNHQWFVNDPYSSSGKIKSTKCKSQVRYLPNKSWSVNVHVESKWREGHGSNLEEKRKK